MFIILFIIFMAWILVMAQKKFDAKRIRELRMIRIQIMKAPSKSEKRRLLEIAENHVIWLETKSFLPASKAEGRALLESIKTFHLI